MGAGKAGDSMIIASYSIYWLYWCKSTNTDTGGAVGAGKAGDSMIIASYSIYWLYWYKVQILMQKALPGLTNAALWRSKHRRYSVYFLYWYKVQILIG